MNDFENRLKDELRREEGVEIDPYVKKKIDETYALIRKKKKRKKVVVRLLAVAIFLFAVGITVTQTAFGASALEYIQMKLFPNSVVKKGYLQNENKVSIDQDVKVTLERAYFDGNEVGFTLAVDYSGNQLLVENEHEMMDYATGAIVESSDGKLSQNDYFTNYELDTDNHIARVYYQIWPKNVGGFSDLPDDMTIHIKHIDGIEKNPKPGFTDEPAVSVVGNWSFLVKRSAIAELKGISYQPDSQNQLSIESATAYPSSFVVRVSDYKGASETLRSLQKNGESSSIRMRVENGSQKTYYDWRRWPLEENDSYLVFDYTGYDDKDSDIYLEIEGMEDIHLKLVK